MIIWYEQQGDFNEINSNVIIFLFLFLKLGIRSKDWLIQGDQSHRPLAGAPF